MGVLKDSAEYIRLLKTVIAQIQEQLDGFTEDRKKLLRACLLGSVGQVTEEPLVIQRDMDTHIFARLLAKVKNFKSDDIQLAKQAWRQSSPEMAELRSSLKAVGFDLLIKRLDNLDQPPPKYPLPVEAKEWETQYIALLDVAVAKIQEYGLTPYREQLLEFYIKASLVKQDNLFKPTEFPLPRFTADQHKDDVQEEAIFGDLYAMLSNMDVERINTTRLIWRNASPELERLKANLKPVASMIDHTVDFALKQNKSGKTAGPAVAGMFTVKRAGDRDIEPGNAPSSTPSNAS